MVAGHDHKSPGVTGGDHISPVSDLRFDKVRNQLDKQIVGVGQIWLLGASAAKKVDGINCKVSGEGRAYMGPLITAGSRRNIMDQKQWMSASTFGIMNISQSPVITERLRFVQHVSCCGGQFETLIDQGDGCDRTGG